MLAAKVKNNNWMILRRGRSMDWLVSQSWGNRAVWLLIFHAQPQEIKKGFIHLASWGKLLFPHQIYCMASSLQSSRGVVVKDSISLVGQPLHIFESQSWAYMYRGLPEILLLRTIHRGKRTLNTVFLHSD